MLICQKGSGREGLSTNAAVLGHFSDPVMTLGSGCEGTVFTWGQWQTASPSLSLLVGNTQGDHLLLLLMMSLASHELLFRMEQVDRGRKRGWRQ